MPPWCRCGALESALADAALAPMSFSGKPTCRMCVFRNICLPDPDEAYEECHTPVARMREEGCRHPVNIEIEILMHQHPGDLWLQILQTERFFAGFFVDENPGGGWLRFPLRDMKPMAHFSSPHYQTITTVLVDYEGHKKSSR